ncbi:MAG: GNAT family N-acetyltransferase [Nitrospirota bacterium]
MNSTEEIINLKEHDFFIEQYINLRNSYAELLLTLPVNISDTKEWLKKNDIEIRGVVQDITLLGVVILYLNKNGEIAFFVREQNKGFGGMLLDIIEKLAIERGLKSVWAWVLKDNLIAQRVFEKKGFIKEEIIEREYKGVIKQGIRYKKYLE